MKLENLINGPTQAGLAGWVMCEILDATTTALHDHINKLGASGYSTQAEEDEVTAMIIRDLDSVKRLLSVGISPLQLPKVFRRRA